MKKTSWLVCGAMLSTWAMAQQTTNPPAAPPPPPMMAPAPETVTPPAEAPAAKPEKKTAKSAKKKAPAEKRQPFVEKPVFLFSGPARIIASNVNVRGQATLNSEVITHLTSGDAVTVLEEITLERHRPDEPAQWARIAMPAGAHAWVNAGYIDATNKVVLPKKLNLRVGPGENHSVIGVLERGAPVTEFGNRGEWMEIEAPTNAYAFVAAVYLKQEGSAAPATPPAAEPMPAPTPLADQAPLAPAPAEAPAVAPSPASAPVPTESMTAPPPAPAPVPAEPAAATPAPEPAPAVAETPLPPRIVQHEGVVKGTWSIQAPTKFALVNPATGELINYLYTSSTNLNLSRYKGLHIVVTGEEGLDDRWKNTPVITIQRIQVVD